ncbi:hypothetical protein ED312_12605 [Sinomicrobium pectinilyticum]|uniref:Uncharacterized protein n=1 Tax=Sinomicrobium pectinilyticum TaxID=1084421 RepID=A0A3N0EC01_SINP1|nr:hypothetical protein [Sinomicrobium pectinilyticum]RNL85375.1 hypothetical protein ED312_12605 [Sinomicrobium pectinilyticum]
MLHQGELQNEIYALLTKIEEEYPELYRLLDENPITIPYIEHPQINDETFSRYLDDLKHLLHHYEQSHREIRA